MAPLNVAFLHPDLGIGGAERLVVDAAVALKRSGHNVIAYTSHHERGHCFQETKDGTLKVVVYGDWLPRNIFGYMHAVCAYVRMIYLAIVVLIVTRNVDVYFVDQVSLGNPFLVMAGKKVLFYCHFPDQLLAKNTTKLKELYRAPLNWLEEKTTGVAHTLMVNSQFTARTFKQTFTTLNVVPEVLYPSLDFSSFDIDHSSVKIDQLVPKAPQHVFLSINRYERKKNLNLALEALVELRSLLKKDFDSVHLVMAGGYDTRVAENVEHYEELSKFAKENKLLNHVTFLKSFSDAEKVALIARCECLVYTPSNEHFGITPLEAMYCNRPVIAVNSGGPLETIADASSSDPQTGFLCAPQPKPFALAMQSLCETPANVVKFGKNGRDRVITKFGFTAFQTQLSKAVEKMAK